MAPPSSENTPRLVVSQRKWSKDSTAAAIWAILGFVETLQHSESIVIARSPDELYDMVSDVTRMGEWSPVCRACWWDEGESPRVGAMFTGRNETPERTWETRSQVVVADRGREFAFEVQSTGTRSGLHVYGGRRGDPHHRVLGVPSLRLRVLPTAVWRRRPGSGRQTAPGRPPGHRRHSGRDQEDGRAGLITGPQAHRPGWAPVFDQPAWDTVSRSCGHVSRALQLPPERRPDRPGAPTRFRGCPRAYRGR